MNAAAVREFLTKIFSTPFGFPEGTPPRQVNNQVHF
jgi:hypothetical protein